eukprot:scaffold215917_cov31-Prasinocladus_malaysianus.AAC.1
MGDPVAPLLCLWVSVDSNKSDGFGLLMAVPGYSVGDRSAHQSVPPTCDPAGVSDHSIDWLSCASVSSCDVFCGTSMLVICHSWPQWLVSGPNLHRPGILVSVFEVLLRRAVPTPVMLSQFPAIRLATLARMRLQPLFGLHNGGAVSRQATVSGPSCGPFNVGPAPIWRAPLNEGHVLCLLVGFGLRCLAV